MKWENVLQNKGIRPSYQFKGAGDLVSFYYMGEGGVAWIKAEFRYS